MSSRRRSASESCSRERPSKDDGGAVSPTKGRGKGATQPPAGATDNGRSRPEVASPRKTRHLSGRAAAPPSADGSSHMKDIMSDWEIIVKSLKQKEEFPKDPSYEESPGQTAALTVALDNKQNSGDKTPGGTCVVNCKSANADTCNSNNNASTKLTKEKNSVSPIKYPKDKGDCPKVKLQTNYSKLRDRSNSNYKDNKDDSILNTPCSEDGTPDHKSPTRRDSGVKGPLLTRTRSACKSSNSVFGVHLEDEVLRYSPKANGDLTPSPSKSLDSTRTPLSDDDSVMEMGTDVTTPEKIDLNHQKVNGDFFEGCHDHQKYSVKERSSGGERDTCLQPVVADPIVDQSVEEIVENVVSVGQEVTVTSSRGAAGEEVLASHESDNEGNAAEGGGSDADDGDYDNDIIEVPKDFEKHATDKIFQILERAKLSDSTKQLVMQDTDYRDLFDISNGDWHKCSFEGFTGEERVRGVCKVCRVTVDNGWSLIRHWNVGHRRRYQCPFDEGHCGVLRGAFALHTHLRSAHAHILTAIEGDLLSDVAKNRLSRWPAPGDGTGLQEQCLEACTCCLLVLGQPERSLHELIVHGLLPPPSMLARTDIAAAAAAAVPGGLGPDGTGQRALEQQLGLWWTGQSVTWCCLLCRSRPFLSCQPHALAITMSQHRQSMHNCNTPILACWGLLLRLLMTLPGKGRRTMACMLSLGLHPTSSYALCRICTQPLGLVNRIRLHVPIGICSDCAKLKDLDKACWYCHKLHFKSFELVSHMIGAHADRAVAGWCPKCGHWAPNLIAHCLSTHKFISSCKFCTFKNLRLSPVTSVLHSINKHSYPCPLPSCSNVVISEEGERSTTQPPLSTMRALITHMLAHHFPDWAGLEIEQINNLIRNANQYNTSVVTAGLARTLDTVWYSLEGRYYQLSGQVTQLYQVAALKVKRQCLLCHRLVEMTLFHQELVVVQLCSQCELGLFQCENGDPPWPCPVSGCTAHWAAARHLYKHIVDTHNHRSCDSSLRCEACLYEYMDSPMRVLCHRLLKHSVPCFMCHEVFDTLQAVRQHRKTAHGSFHWADFFTSLQAQYGLSDHIAQTYESNEDKGVVKVWMSCGGLMAQWDPLIPVSGMTINTGEESMETESTANSRPSSSTANAITHPQTIMDAAPWYGSYCSVSMSPTKPLGTPPLLPSSTMPNASHSEAATAALQEVAVKATIKIKSTQESEQSQVSKMQPPPPQRAAVSENDSSDDDDASSEPALEIDSTAVSPIHSTATHDVVHSKEAITSKSKPSITIPLNLHMNPLSSEMNENHSDALKSPTESPNSSLNQSMSLEDLGKTSPVKVVPPLMLNRKKMLVKKSPKEQKGLGANAFIDADSVSENILKDLDEKYRCECVECGVSVLLKLLKQHLMTAHRDTSIRCQCGFTSDITSVLVHSFHMSHLPNEARPLTLLVDGEHVDGVLVFERRSGGANAFPCFKCGKKFKQEKSRQLHYNLCKLEKKFECDQCGEKFVRDFHLLKHKEWKHNPQNCPHCTKAFTSQASLTQHVLHIHKKAYQYKCQWCSSGFPTKAHVKVHSRLHTGEKPHTCDRCIGASFISRNLLEKHIANKHASKGQSSDDELGTPLKIKRRRSLTSLVVNTNKESDSDSSSDSSSGSSSDEETGSPTKKESNNEGSKDIPSLSTRLTESDLETSVSESDELVPVIASKSTPKRNLSKDPDYPTPKKSSLATITPKRGVISKDSDSTPKKERMVHQQPLHQQIQQQQELLQKQQQQLQEHHQQQQYQPDRDDPSMSNKASSGATAAASLQQQSVIASVEEQRQIRQDTIPELEPVLKANMVSTVESSIGSSRCKPCGKTFTGPGGKLLHLYLFHPGIVITQGLHQCGFCTYIFTTAEDVTEHHLQMHQRHPLPDGMFKCLCGLRFREDGAFYFHLYYAHKAQKALSRKSDIICRVCECCPKLNKIVDLVVHLSDRHAMFDHVRVDQSFVCTFCYKGFDSWTVLSLHFFMVHNATKSQNLSYDCPYCETSSPWHSLEALQYHLDNFHGSRSKAAVGDTNEAESQQPQQQQQQQQKAVNTPATSKRVTKAVTASAKRKPIGGPSKTTPTPAILGPQPPKKRRKRIAKVDEVEGIGRDHGWSGDPETLYCICQCPYDEVSDMIGCDNAECKYQWFHFECVGIMAAPEGNWYCSDCTNSLQEKSKRADALQQELERTVNSDLYEYYSNYHSNSEDEVTSNVPQPVQHHYSTAGHSSSKEHHNQHKPPHHNSFAAVPGASVEDDNLSNSSRRRHHSSSSSSSNSSSSSSSSNSSSSSSSSSGDSSSASDNE